MKIAQAVKRRNSATGICSYGSQRRKVGIDRGSLRRLVTLSSLAAVVMLGMIPFAPSKSVAAESEADEYVAYVNGVEVGSSDGFIPFWITPGCGTGEKSAKLIKSWTRWTNSGRHPAYLRCGTQVGNWSYRHITDGHADDWNNIRVKYGLGGHWTDLVLNSTAGNLGSIVGTVSESNGKDVHKSPLCIYNRTTGKADRVYDVMTPVIQRNDNIVTSYPTNGRSSDKHCPPIY